VDCGKDTPFSTLYARCVESDDRGAWDELIRRFHPVVRRAARGTFHLLAPGKYAREDVEDVGQESWVKLLRDDRKHLREHPNRSEGEFHMYLRQTAVNTVRDRLNAKSRIKRPRIAALDQDQLDFILAQVEDGAMTPDHWTHVQQIKEQITPLLRKNWSEHSTCERDIAICNLAFMEQLSAARIASIASFGLSRGGVEKVIERGRKILQSHFGGPGARSRSVDDGHFEPGGPSGDGWRDSEEILEFVLGELDETTTARRMEMLSRDAEARRTLAEVVTLLDAPLDPKHWGHLREEDIPAYYAALLARAQRRSSSAVVNFPRWPRPAALEVLLATAAVLFIAISPLLRSKLPDPILGGTTQPVAPEELHLQYPSGVAAPLRLAQDFSREAPGSLRGSESGSSEAQMLAAEETLILQRSRGVDPVGTSNALAHLKLARGKLDLAEQNYRESLQHDPLNGEALIGLAIVEYQRSLEAQGETERRDLLREAEALLMRVESSSPHYLRALYDHIQVALALHEVETAERLLQRYEELGPDDGWAPLLRAAVQKAQRP
jgi:DNA-directed RNA polymerase specialized sigma24 family protein